MTRKPPNFDRALTEFDRASALVNRLVIQTRVLATRARSPALPPNRRVDAASMLRAAIESLNPALTRLHTAVARLRSAEPL